MTVDKKPPPFEIIRHHGRHNEGHLPDGTKVYGKTQIFFNEVNRFVPVAPYSNHFIYEVPDRILGPKWRCSCGSAAVCAGYSGYKDAASQQGLLIVCLEHASTGLHLGDSKWI